MKNVMILGCLTDPSAHCTITPAIGCKAYQPFGRTKRVPWIAQEEFQIPVGMAFFFFNSALGRVTGFYPSPAGATESLLPLAAWQAFAAGGDHVAVAAGEATHDRLSGTVAGAMASGYRAAEEVLLSHRH